MKLSTNEYVEQKPYYLKRKVRGSNLYGNLRGGRKQGEKILRLLLKRECYFEFLRNLKRKMKNPSNPPITLDTFPPLRNSIII